VRFRWYTPPASARNRDQDVEGVSPDGHRTAPPDAVVAGRRRRYTGLPNEDRDPSDYRSPRRCTCGNEFITRSTKTTFTSSLLGVPPVLHGRQADGHGWTVERFKLRQAKAGKSN